MKSLISRQTSRSGSLVDLVWTTSTKRQVKIGFERRGLPLLQSLLRALKKFNSLKNVVVNIAPGSNLWEAVQVDILFGGI